MMLQLPIGIESLLLDKVDFLTHFSIFNAFNNKQSNINISKPHNLQLKVRFVLLQNVTGRIKRPANETILYQAVVFLEIFASRIGK